MCCIIQLPAGKMLMKERLVNVTLNNPHGFGIVTVDKGKLDIYKSFHEDGNDPDHVEEELNKRVNLERFLHLRYATAGEKSIDNTHPFKVYEGKDNHTVVFMHNGSLHKFKETGSDRSDTYHFAEKLLSPLLYKFTGDEGIADIEDPFLEILLQEHFSSTNRGLLISNKKEPLFLGGWLNIVVESTEYKVSNTDYFYNITESRLTEKEKEKRAAAKRFQEAQQRERDEHERSTLRQQQQGQLRLVHNDSGTEEESAPTVTAGASDGAKKTEVKGGLTLLKEIDLSSTTRFLVPNDVSALFGGAAMDIDDELAQYISMFAFTELTAWSKAKPIEAARLIEWMANRLTNAIGDYEDVAEKQARAERHIIKLRKDNETQAALLVSTGHELAELKAALANKDGEIRELSRGRKQSNKKDAA